MSKPRGRPPHDDVLTPAEWRIAHGVRHGMTNRQIAARRGISVDAVKFHVANIVVKLGLVNRRALRHWSGAPKDSALAAKEKTMTDELSIQGIGQIARTVADVETSTTWYRDVLGLKHMFTVGKLAFFDLDGVRLMLDQKVDVQPTESILYLRVPDIDAAYRSLQARGVEFFNAPHMIYRHDDGTEEWMAFFNDPEGRPLSIMATAGP